MLDGTRRLSPIYFIDCFYNLLIVITKAGRIRNYLQVNRVEIYLLPSLDYKGILYKTTSLSIETPTYNITLKYISPVYSVSRIQVLLQRRGISRFFISITSVPTFNYSLYSSSRGLIEFILVLVREYLVFFRVYRLIKTLVLIVIALYIVKNIVVYPLDIFIYNSQNYLFSQIIPVRKISTNSRINFIDQYIYYILGQVSIFLRSLLILSNQINYITFIITDIQESFSKFYYSPPSFFSKTSNYLDIYQQ